MATNKKPRKKKFAFSAKQQRPGSAKKLAKLNAQIMQFYQQGNIQEALNFSQQALIIFPKDAKLLKNAGGFAGMMGNQALLEKYTLKALEVNPNDAKAHYNLAKLLTEQKHLTKAQSHYQTALQLNPNYINAHNNLANLLKEQKYFSEAQSHYQAALQLNPDYVEAHNNLAILLKEQKRFTEAQSHYQTVLQLDPNNIEAQLDLSLLFLRLGNLQQGWQYYESRYHPDKKDRQSVPLETLALQYQGEDLMGKNLLIYPEQGFGDEIQFIRYLPLLKSQKGVENIILVCKSPLKKLFSNMDGIDHLLDENEFKRADIQGIHYWVFIMSLPLYFNTTLETIPQQLPYLSSPQSEQNNWKNKLPKQIGNNFNIGLVWKGRVEHKNDTNRSLSSLKTLKPLWDLKNKLKNKTLNFVSLQKDASEDEAQNPPIDQPLIHLGNQIQDFSDTAAIVSQLDLVICVDTAIAHLAGSLNVPCWVLLPDYKTDWRWLLDREDSPWYPNTVRLFRQTTDGDWTEVVARVTEALVIYANSQSIK